MISKSVFTKSLHLALREAGYYREIPDRDGVVRPINQADTREILQTISDEIYNALIPAKSIKRLDGAKSRALAEVAVPNLGKWTVVMRPPRPARMGRNPATGESIKIPRKPASKRVRFLTDKSLRDDLDIK